MRYAVLLYVDTEFDAGPGSPEWEASLPTQTAFAGRMAAQGVPFTGGGLYLVKAATSVQRREGRLIASDGPFAETREQLWGYYDLEAPDLDAVLALVDGLWGLEHGTVEIRPVFPAPEPPDDPPVRRRPPPRPARSAGPAPRRAEDAGTGGCDG